jgi:hypothetical protein
MKRKRARRKVGKAPLAKNVGDWCQRTAPASPRRALPEVSTARDAVAATQYSATRSLYGLPHRSHMKNK